MSSTRVCTYRCTRPARVRGLKEVADDRSILSPPDGNVYIYIRPLIGPR
jgi:hypothetical protein